MKIVVLNHLSLDGVMQAPGGPNEDPRGGFLHGGWAVPGNDEVMGRKLGEGFDDTEGALLFGHRSYAQMLAYWDEQGGPFSDRLKSTHKYVASRDPDAPLPWPNSTLLAGDVPAAVAALRAQPGGHLVIMGSGQLIRSLLPSGLIDEYLLMIHPVVLGSGLQLFGDEDDVVRLELVEAVPTTTGVILATYRPHAVEAT